MAQWGAYSSTRSTSATPKAPVRFVGLDNISAVLADPAFTGAVVNNVIYAVGTAIPSIGLALLFSWRWRGPTS